MANDRQEELERLEKALLAQETETLPFSQALTDTPAQEDAQTQADDILEDPQLRKILTEPAFEDMDEIKDPREPLVYCNYSNDYGRDLEEFTDNAELPVKEKKDDKLSVGLMFTASGLCLGLIGVMIFWLARYL